MSVKVVITADDREVTVEMSGNTPVAEVLAQALHTWRRTRTRRPPERPVIEAGGMGFQAELAPIAEPDDLRSR